MNAHTPEHAAWVAACDAERRLGGTYRVLCPVHLRTRLLHGSSGRKPFAGRTKRCKLACTRRHGKFLNEAADGTTRGHKRDASR
jgi:hypothetical protein